MDDSSSPVTMDDFVADPVVAELKKLNDLLAEFVDMQRAGAELMKIQLQSVKQQMGGITPVITMPGGRAGRGNG